MSKQETKTLHSLHYCNAQETENHTAKFQKLEINFINFSLTSSSFALTFTLQHFVAKKQKRAKSFSSK